MLDRMSGKIIHIDFGDCFEVAMVREKFPEKIPFRLTRMLINAMEVWYEKRVLQVACGLWYCKCTAAWQNKTNKLTSAPSEDSDQPGWMPRLIWVCAGRTDHFVGFVMRRLKCGCPPTQLGQKCGSLSEASFSYIIIEPRHKKTCPWNFRPGKTRTNQSAQLLWM